MYTSDDLANLSPEEKKKKRNSLQMEVIMLESDLRKAVAQKGVLDAEIRKLKYDEERIRVSVDAKKKELEQTVFKITESETEIKRIKKKLNLLV